MSPVPRIIVFVKYPAPGEVKTRLGNRIGMKKAAALYRTWVPPFIESLLKLENRIPLEIALATGPEEKWGPAADQLAEAKRWLPYPVDWSFQNGSDLGERLQRAFDRSLENGSKTVLVFGSDSPHLGRDEVEKLLDLLAQNDMVLGPTEDGGYYAIGMRKSPKSLFSEVGWSTESTLTDTVTAAESRGWTVGLGPAGFDVDTVSDLNRLIETEPPKWTFLEKILLDG